jgi:hypothetical protein
VVGAMKRQGWIHPESLSREVVPREVSNDVYFVSFLFTVLDRLSLTATGNENTDALIVDCGRVIVVALNGEVSGTKSGWMLDGTKRHHTNF